MSKNTNKSDLLPEPTVEAVYHYLEKIKTLENYFLQEEALKKLFGFIPENKDIKDVLLKASVLNDFYSTNIYSIYSVAKHILGIKNFDMRIKAGDITLVDELKKTVISNKERNFYSFATKYCAYHNPIDYPIYDSYVDKVIFYFSKKYEFSSFIRSDLRDYSKFKAILLDFQKFFKLEQFGLRELDLYLWLLGKEHFQNN